MVVGPSGVGKSTIVARLRQLRPDLYWSVSVTTRERRPGEVAGVDYDFISDGVMQYFKRRLAQAPDDAAFALEYVKRNARTPAEQRAVLAALEFKCGVLWSMLDALHFAYVAPGHIPPGAFVPR